MSDATDYSPVIPAHRVLWALGALLWTLLLAALLSYSPHDIFGHATSAAPDAPLNWIGAAGAFVSHELISLFGLGAYILLACGLIALVYVGFIGPLSHPLVRALGALLVAVSLPTAHALLAPELSRMPEGGGGLLGIAFAGALRDSIGVLGAALTLTAATLLGLWVAFDRLIYDVPAAAAQRVFAYVTGKASTLREKARAAAERRNDIDDDARLRSVNKAMAAKKPKKAKAGRQVNEDDGLPNAPAVLAADRAADFDDPEPEDEYEEDEYEEYDDEELDENGNPLDEDALREKIAASPEGVSPFGSSSTT